MIDNDQDEPADTSGMEPELRPGMTEPEVSGGAGDEDAVFGGDAPPVPRPSRRMSDEARKLMVEAVTKLKASRKSEDDEGATGEFDEAPAPRPVNNSSAPPAPAPVAPPAQAAPSPAPAPSIDPAVLETKRQYEARLADLDARERAIKDREAAPDLAGFRDAYLERPAAALRDLMKARGIATTDEEWKEEIRDLITELSGSELGVELPQDVRNRLDARRAMRAVKNHKEQLTAREAKLEAERRAAADEAARLRAVEMLGGQMRATENASKWPYLAAEDDPGRIIFDVVDHQNKLDGSVMKWEEAAQKANDYLKQQAEAYYGRRKHLLSVATGKPGDAASGSERVQGDPQGIRRSHTLSNAAAASAPTTAPKADGPSAGKWSREAHRAETKRRMRAAFAPGDGG